MPARSAIFALALSASSVSIPPTLVLVNETGSQVRPAASAGTPALLVIGRLSELDAIRSHVDASEGAGLAPGFDFRAYVVSVDPEDGPEEAAAARDALDVDGWSFLTGECDSGLLLGRIHPRAATVVLRPDGRVFRVLAQPTGREVRAALSEANGSAPRYAAVTDLERVLGRRLLSREPESSGDIAVMLLVAATLGLALCARWASLGRPRAKAQRTPTMRVSSSSRTSPMRSPGVRSAGSR